MEPSGKDQPESLSHQLFGNLQEPQKDQAKNKLKSFFQPTQGNTFLMTQQDAQKLDQKIEDPKPQRQMFQGSFFSNQPVTLPSKTQLGESVKLKPNVKNLSILNSVHSLKKSLNISPRNQQQASFNPNQGHSMFKNEGSKSKTIHFGLPQRSIVSLGSAGAIIPQIKSKNELISGQGLFRNLKPQETKATRELLEQLKVPPKEKRPLTELLAEYEKRRIQFDKIRLNDFSNGGEPLIFDSIQKAIKRMSHDYQITEEELRKQYQANDNIRMNLQRYELIQDALSPSPPRNADFSDAVSNMKKNCSNEIYTVENLGPRDFKSDMAKFTLLKTIINYANLIHLNEFEIVYWHIINLKMLEDGLWSKFKFEFQPITGGSNRKDHHQFGEILLMSALMAKKLCNTEDEYEIFEEFVFHNLDEAVEQKNLQDQNTNVPGQATKPKNHEQKVESKEEQKIVSMREKFEQWKTNIFENHLSKKYKDFYGMKQMNHYYKILFYEQDFESLTHPKFWNLESYLLSTKERTRNRSRRSSISQCLYGYKKSRSRANSICSQTSNKTSTSRGYISKKKKKQMEKEEQNRQQMEKKEQEKMLREEEEFRNSKHIQQLQHMADICEDYNYIVDQLEDEHCRRTVHTTQEIKK